MHSLMIHYKADRYMANHPGQERNIVTTLEDCCVSFLPLKVVSNPICITDFPKSNNQYFPFLPGQCKDLRILSFSIVPPDSFHFCLCSIHILNLIHYCVLHLRFIWIYLHICNFYWFLFLSTSLSFFLVSFFFWY